MACENGMCHEKEFESGIYSFESGIRYQWKLRTYSDSLDVHF